MHRTTVTRLSQFYAVASEVILDEPKKNEDYVDTSSLDDETTTFQELLELDKSVEIKKRELRQLSQSIVARYNWDLTHLYCKQPYQSNTDRSDTSFTVDQDTPVGVLTLQKILSCLSHLAECPFTGKQVYTICNLSRMGLFDIKVLGDFYCVQCLNVSYNLLTTLKNLSKFRFLRSLDASHNILVGLLDFSNPYNLREVNYSYNKIDTIKDLSNFWSIVTLDLSHNNIEKIEGLECLRFLQKLNLSFNLIERLENINGLPINTLNLSNNNISEFLLDSHKGLHTLKELETVNLDYNKILSLEIFHWCTGIQEISMKCNKVEYMFDLISFTKGLKRLRILDLSFNPISFKEKFINVCCLLFPNITLLNGQAADENLKESNPDYFSNDIIKQAESTLLNLTLMEMLNPPKYEHNTKMLEALCSWPIIIISGPPQSGKGALCHKVSEGHCDKVYQAFLHTTKPISLDQPTTRRYYYVTDNVFVEMAKHNNFITCCETNGVCVGLSFSEVRIAMKKRKLLISHLGSVAALALKARSKGTYILLGLKQNTGGNYRKSLSQSKLLQNQSNEVKTHQKKSESLKLPAKFDLNLQNRNMCKCDDYKPLSDGNKLDHENDFIKLSVAISKDSFFDPDNLKMLYGRVGCEDRPESSMSGIIQSPGSKDTSSKDDINFTLENSSIPGSQQNASINRCFSKNQIVSHSLSHCESSSQNICCAEINSCEALRQKIINLSFFEPYEPAGEISLLPNDCLTEVYVPSTSSYFSPDKVKHHSSIDDQAPTDKLVKKIHHKLFIPANTKNPVNRLESDPQLHQTDCLDDIERDTNALLRLQCNFPEIFYDMILTDNLEDASKRIVLHVTELYLKHLQKKKYYIF